MSVRQALFWETLLFPACSFPNERNISCAAAAGGNLGGNTALYGPLIASPTIFMASSWVPPAEVESGKPFDTRSEEEGDSVTPGCPTHRGIVIAMEDFYGQVVLINYAQAVGVFGINETSLVGKTTNTATCGGYAVFSDVGVSRYPGQVGVLQFQSEGLATTVKIKVTTRLCGIGEVFSPTYGSPDAECMRCPLGTYSFDPSPPANATCLDCPEGALCYGGSDIKAKNGWWRFDPQVDTVFNECSLAEVDFPY